jgi:hypothetical protein
MAVKRHPQKKKIMMKKRKRKKKRKRRKSKHHSQNNVTSDLQTSLDLCPCGCRPHSFCSCSPDCRLQTQGFRKEAHQHIPDKFPLASFSIRVAVKFKESRRHFGSS